MVVLQLCAIDHPGIFVGTDLPDADPALALRLAKEVVALPVLVRAGVAGASSVALADERLAHLLVLVSLVASLSVSYSGKAIELIKQLHKLVF